MFLESFAGILLGFTMAFQSWGYMMPHQNPMDTLLLVNKQNKAPVLPVMLMKPSVDPVEEKVSGNIYMRPDAAAALERMFNAAGQEGIKLYALSGFRSYATQKAIYNRKDRSESRISSVAKPGYSEHQTGLAMDFEGESTLGKGLTEAIAASPEGIWVDQHCWEYGFILRYPKGKEHITGYIYEPWHIRFVGTEAAMEIRNLDVTFEEYIRMIRRERIKNLEQEEIVVEQENTGIDLSIHADPDGNGKHGGTSGSGDYGKRGGSTDTGRENVELSDSI